MAELTRGISRNFWQGYDLRKQLTVQSSSRGHLLFTMNDLEQSMCSSGYTLVQMSAELAALCS